MEIKIISAHRTPDRMYEYASNAEKNNVGVIIAGAGGSAHLPGMIAALTPIPVLGVPIESVDIIVDINHTYRGDLDIVLQSPDGTESWLAVSNGDSNDDYSDWLFNTVHHWGESSMGLWTLKVRDSTSGGMGTLNSWELIFHGVDKPRDLRRFLA